MMKYIKSKYSFFEELEHRYLHYSSASNEFLLLNSAKHALLTDLSPEELEKTDADFFNMLVKKRFLVPADADETLQITQARQRAMLNKDWYHVVVNTTLDCNLDCWYCYENRVKGSKLTPQVIAQICRNIEAHYALSPYTLLKVSFFGGEPFMNPKGMRAIIEFAREFCESREIELILDFTTNATLIDEEMVDYLSPFTCYFQITLDGAEGTHNEIKKARNTHLNTYRKTIEALRLIDSKIEHRLIAVRINFDNKVLNEIDSIIADISFLDREHCYVIVKKVWQVDRDGVNREPLLQVIQKLLDNDFLPDYYVMPKGGVCFAERENQVLFNYDGNVFKCTTITSFDKENTLGDFDPESGLVTWKKDVMDEWLGDMQQPECLSCKWYGACYGPCNRQLMAHKGQFICTFDAMNLSQKEYLMYLFKYNILYNKIHHLPLFGHAQEEIRG